MTVKEKHLKWLILTICCVVVLVNTGIRMSFGIFFKPLQTILDVSRNQLSLVQSVFELGFGIFQLTVGRFIDIGGPKKIMAAGLAILAISFWYISRVQNIWLLVLVYGTLIAFGAGSTSLVANIALTRQWFIYKSTLAISLVTVSVSAGQLIFVPVISSIVSGYGLGFGYRYLSLLAFFSLILVLLGVRKPLVNSTGPAKKSGEPYLIKFSQVYNSRSFWVFGLSFMICGFGFSFVATHLIPFATDQQMHVVQASNALALIGGASILGTLLTGYVSQYLSKQFTTFLLFMIRASAMLLVLGSVSATSVYLFAIVVGLTWTATVPLITSMSSDRFGVGNTGTVLGALFLLHQIGAAAGSYFGGLVADYTHGYHLMFIISAILDAAAALLILTYKPPVASTAAISYENNPETSV